MFIKSISEHKRLLIYIYKTIYNGDYPILQPKKD